MRLILASASPRRKQILSGAGFEFEVRPATVDETPLAGELPEDCARRLAREKALQVAATETAETLVLGADTVVVADHEILGKPQDAADARRMLRILSGITHRVITGVCLVRAPSQVVALTHETTLITFRNLDDEEIARYVASGEPMDKAGAYGIQGLASKFVTRVEGCYFNVVGLPVARVDELLRGFR